MQNKLPIDGCGKCKHFQQVREESSSSMVGLCSNKKSAVNGIEIKDTSFFCSEFEGETRSCSNCSNLHIGSPFWIAECKDFAGSIYGTYVNDMHGFFCSRHETKKESIDA